MGLLNSTRVSATVGGKEIILETGRVARQANGAIWIQCGGTVALVTVCEAQLETPKDFFPLTVEYAERMYAAGRIPGNFFRREIGRPSDHETLVARLIDRPIRPLFPKGYGNEVQVLATVISADGENDPDVLCITAASAATCISSIPFAGPVAGARLGRVDGQFILNPTNEELKRSDMDIVLAASRDAVVMVEGEARLVKEQDLIDGLNWAHKAILPLIDAHSYRERLRLHRNAPFFQHTEGVPGAVPGRKHADFCRDTFLSVDLHRLKTAFPDNKIRKFRAETEASAHFLNLTAQRLDDLYQNIRAEMRFLLIEDFLRSAGLDEALQHFMIPSG